MFFLPLFLQANYRLVLRKHRGKINSGTCISDFHFESVIRLRTVYHFRHSQRWQGMFRLPLFLQANYRLRLRDFLLSMFQLYFFILRFENINGIPRIPAFPLANRPPAKVADPGGQKWQTRGKWQTSSARRRIPTLFSTTFKHA